MFLPTIVFKIDSLGFRRWNRSLTFKRCVNAKPVGITLGSPTVSFRALLPSKTAIGPNILDESCRSIAQQTDATTSSTTPHVDSSHKHFRVTHPFHPLFGQKFELVESRTNWGESRVYFCDSQGHVRSISTSYTDVVVDPFVEIAAGRSYFRFDDLVQLVALLEQLR
jgi:hypothetical protein